MPAPFEQSPALAAVSSVRHGFFGREGGVSAGDFASNNMSLTVGDAPDWVETNRASAAATLGYGGDDLCLVRQTHSTIVRVLTERPGDDGLHEADAIVSTVRGLALGILTADCTPVLFVDPMVRVIGAAHAGWRGAVDGICTATVKAMVELGADPSRIMAAIGPTISGANYEVGDNFMDDFMALQPEGYRHFSQAPGERTHFDLPGFVAAQLEKSGVATIERIGGCTYGQPHRYFSHRYATHHQTRTGRQIAIIGLT
jgi:polyphenol oxidase